MVQPSPSNSRGQTPPTLRQLAWFRYQLRQFLRFSEKAARACGVTPQQHQLLLGIAGYTGRGWATIAELAEFLQERHNAVVGLVERAAQKGLVQKKQSAGDRRYVRVRLSPRGKTILDRITRLHREELGPAQAQLVKTFRSQPAIIKPAQGA